MEATVAETPVHTYQEQADDNEEAILEHLLHSEMEPKNTDKEESKEEGNVPPEEEYRRGLQKKKTTQRGIEYEMQRKEKMLNTAIRHSEK